MQSIFQEVDGELRRIDLPDEDGEVLPGIPWGDVHTPFTPAFWAGRFRAHELLGTYGRFRAGSTLAEEVGFCLIGGYGIPAEVGWAAYRRLNEAGVFARPVDAEELEILLQEPLNIDGRPVRYRFARKKGRQLAPALAALRGEDVSALTDIELRAWLLQLPGIGPKTASWIVRGHRSSNMVAIIDIHIERAGKVAGLFPEYMTTANNYFDMEKMFLKFSAAIGAPASLLDHMMWNVMKKIGWQLSRA